MLAVAFFRWWYTAGWLRLISEIKRRLIRLGQTFSVLLLLRTLFKPWKQVVALRDPNATIGMRMRGLVDNLISRFVGLWVRLFTIAAGALTIVALSIVGLMTIIAWPFMPPFSVLLALMSVVAR